MKIKKVVMLTSVISLLLSGCGDVNININQTTSDKEEASGTEETNEVSDDVSEGGDEEPLVGLANPWRDASEDEATEGRERMFRAPDYASNTVWRIMDGNIAPDDDKEPLIELDFDIVDEYSTRSFTARYRKDAEPEDDISGMFYEWDVEDEGTLSGWELPAKFYRSLGEDETVDLCTWYDEELGIAYSLSVAAEDLDGFDIQAVVENMYNGDDDGSDDSDIPGSDEADAHEMTTDIEGCDTFTQIVDNLDAGKGYTNVTLGDEDVLLVASGTYDNLDGNNAAIDAEIFRYDDGVPSYAGYVEAGGTAYPLAVKDESLYAGSNHSVTRYTVTDGKLTVAETAGETFDADGNASYYYDSDDGEDHSDMDQDEIQKIFDDLINEYFEAEILNFDAIK